MAVAASSSTGTVRRLPPNVPTGVRTGATIAALRVVMGRVVMIRSSVQSPAYSVLSCDFISLPASLRGRSRTNRTVLGAL